ncbi:MAG: hypothetical protein ACXWLJ_07895 [Rhizomicrobium sp.]
MRAFSRSPAICAALSLLILAACVSRAPPLRGGQIGLISGRETVGLSSNAARNKVLAEAARLTVDHGLRYFILLPAPQMAASPARPQRAGADTAIRPGVDVTFRALRKDPVGGGAWDAYRVLGARKAGSHGTGDPAVGRD